jgi:hypothetical protein
MNPFTVVLMGCLHPLALLAGLGLKWWVIWFALGRNFSRTSVLSLLAFCSSAAAAFVVIQSQAAGMNSNPSVDSEYPAYAWLTAFILVWLGLSSVEMWALRLGMRRMVRSEWSWRRSDLAVYQTVFGIWMVLSVMPLWWN